MEKIIAHQENVTDYNKTASYEAAAKETDKTEELSCNQQLKNLLITNLRLLKLNDISTFLLF